VAQALWELSDGTTNFTNIENVIILALKHKSSIASLEDLYNFWDTSYGLTQDECLIFAQRDVVREKDCDDDFVSDEVDEPIITRHTIEYDTQSSSALVWEARDIWSFEGLAEDVISILILKIDDDIDIQMSLIQAWDNRVVETVLVDDESEYTEWQAKLENNGEHLILVDAVDSEGQYSIYLELMQRWVGEDGAPSEDETPEADLATEDVKSEDVTPDETSDATPPTPDPDIEIEYGDTVTEFIFEGDTEWWEFSGQAGDVISIRFWSWDGDFSPYLYFGEDSSGAILMETGPGEYEYEAYVERYSLPETGLYFIGVESTSGDGDYGLQLFHHDGVEEEGSSDSTNPPSDSESPPGTVDDKINLGPTVSFTLYNDSDFPIGQKDLYDHVTPDGEAKEWVFSLDHNVPPDAPEYIVAPGAEDIGILDPKQYLTVQVPPGTYLVGLMIDHPDVLPVSVWIDKFEISEGTVLHVTNDIVEANR
jgi:hypothetical protein